MQQKEFLIIIQKPLLPDLAFYAVTGTYPATKTAFY